MVRHIAVNGYMPCREKEIWRLVYMCPQIRPYRLQHVRLHGVHSPSGHCSHRITGTVEILLKGDPLMTRVLYARYTSVRCARSTIRTTRVSLKMSDVRSLNTSAFFGSCARSTVIGHTCRHAMAKRERSSATPNVPFIPPVRACERWHVTPGTLGSSKALTQILSFAPQTRNVVETQPISAAWRQPTAPPSNATRTMPTHDCHRIASPPQHPLITLAPHLGTRLGVDLWYLKLVVPEKLLHPLDGHVATLPAFGLRNQNQLLLKKDIFRFEIHEPYIPDAPRSQQL